MGVLQGCKVKEQLEAGHAELDAFGKQAGTANSSVNVPLKASAQEGIPALDSGTRVGHVHHEEAALIFRELFGLTLKKRVRTLVREWYTHGD
jgi:hypothetical protein